MASLTDKVPGTGSTYNDAFGRLVGDVIPSPRYGQLGNRLSKEEQAANPAWSFRTYLRGIVEDVRLLRGEIEAMKLRQEAILAAIEGVDDEGIKARIEQAVEAQATQHAALVGSLKSQLLETVPTLVDALAAELDGVAPEQIQSAVEAGVRSVLGSLD